MLRRSLLVRLVASCGLFLSGLAAPAFASPPAVQEPFIDQALARGVDLFVIGGGTAGRGVALVDLVRDGDVDLVALGRADDRVAVFANDGTGSFEERTLTTGIDPLAPGASSGVVAGDYDGDGRLDLYLTVAGSPDRLERNTGTYTFEDVTTAAGLGDVGFGNGCTFGDYDGDGFLDLYLSNVTTQAYPSPNKLYRNRGDGTFEHVVAGIDEGASLQTWQSVFFDFDSDGDPDLYNSNDKGGVGTGQHNFLWENVGGTFVNVTDTTMTHVYGDSMGIAVGDFDGNDLLEVYCTNIGANPLLLNSGSGAAPFVDVAVPSGVTSDSTGWGTLFLDHDNDTYLDLFVCNFDDYNRLFEHEGTLLCHDVASQMGVEGGSSSLSHCVASGDVDGDGDVDLAVSSYFVPLRLYINQEDGTRNWLEVDLFGRAPNTYAVGARLEAKIGSRQLYRQVLAGIGFKSSSSFVSHLGLGDATVVDLLTVHWPSGGTTELTDVAANQRLELREPGLPPVEASPRQSTSD